jgi:hypothetical protein
MMYMKILLGGITNTQNNALLEWKNFGSEGVLSSGDQFSIIFGNLCFLVALVLFTMIAISLVYTPSWMFMFGKKVQGVENLLRRKGNHKWFLFSMGQLKTFMMVYIIVFMSNSNFAVPQLMLALIINPSNLFIAWKLVPLPKVRICNVILDLTLIAKIADVSAILIIYHQLMMSDVNPPPVSAKITLGYVVILLGQLKFMVGNIKQVGHDYNVHNKRINASMNKIKRKFCWFIFYQDEHFDQRVSKG